MSAYSFLITGFHLDSYDGENKVFSYIEIYNPIFEKNFWQKNGNTYPENNIIDNMITRLYQDAHLDTQAQILLLPEELEEISLRMSKLYGKTKKYIRGRPTFRVATSY
jgi:hypothetical protein